MQQITADIDNSPRIPPAQHAGARRFRTIRVVAALILRETGSRESTTSLGFLWTMIEPMAASILMTAIFSIMSRNPPLGTNFMLFYLTGMATFQMYTTVQGRVSSAIRFSRPLLGFPSVTVLDAILARFLLNVFIHTIEFAVLVSAVIWYYQLRVVPDFYDIMLSISMAAALGLGVGSLNAVLFLASPTYESVWTIMMRPLMLMSGVIFLVNELPTAIAQYVMWNPVVHVIGMMRHAFYPTYDASYVSVGYVFLVAGITFSLGLVGLHRYVFDALDR